ncbi:hypothetical protein GIB67_042300 [Kingdonia uniflora]|uniref:Uncharacterized protein n=1 Tax=Kingdonia uniflora TaxID=39325 RepID=A0A7J7LE34_9MAGN|nr:hypothetical protein GIB67_042300 [Kingdonia uniflora]
MINFISPGLYCKGLSTTKDTGSGKGLSTTKAGGPLRHNSFTDLEPKYGGYPKINIRGLNPIRFRPFVNDIPQSSERFKTIRTDVPSSNEPNTPQSKVYLSNKHMLTNIPQSNEPFETITVDVSLSNKSCIPQSNVHLSNEPMITNAPLSNKPMLANAHLLIKLEPIIGQTEPSGNHAEFVICNVHFNISYQICIMLRSSFLIYLAEFRFESQPEQVKDLVDFWFKSITYTEDLYDFSKDFTIGDLHRDRIVLKNHIRAYAVIYATRLLGYALFKVSTYCSMHICIRVKTDGENAYKAAFSKWVTTIFKRKLQKDPNYKPFRIIEDMHINHNIDVTYNLAWRAIEKVHAEIRGSFEHAYQLLTSYFAEVRPVVVIDGTFIEREISWDSTNRHRHLANQSYFSTCIFSNRLRDYRKLDILPGDV